ncbi:fasciclin domain-containing protein [Pontibacter amylolyticus]|uniref:Osteoblast specific factor 2-related protein n=1 Tax=Pontibacter amylolyticus TaxID=1424080 RepID=A0ABQ1W9Y6_9BACT|nr:fasciclin domain-containing protein [Pontibacter amylolyticus]GGG20275.1 osteoblast specific factor 2-related protein [Pontibacter amylolyticus]
MKAFPYLLTLFGLAMLLITACDQSNNSQTGNEAARQEGADALQAKGPVEAQAANALQSPESTNDARVSARSLLDNIAANSDLSTFNSLLRKAGVAKSLSGTGPYTVLAPTEAAFRGLPDSLRDNLESSEHRELVQQLLNNHIIAGKLTTSDLQDGAILKTAAGHQLKVAKRDDKIQIGNALMEKPDGMSSNGVLHTIDKVLVPVKEAAL